MFVSLIVAIIAAINVIDVSCMDMELRRMIFNHHVDYTPLFTNKDQLEHTMKCLLDEEPCGEYEEHKHWFQYIVKDDCGYCNPVQKERYMKIKDYIKTKYPDYYQALEEKYGPERH